MASLAMAKPVFEPHQRDVIDKGQIAGDPSDRFLDNRRCQCKDDTYFDALAAVLELKNAQHGFVESALGMHDVIMDMIDRRQSDRVSPGERLFTAWYLGQPFLSNTSGTWPSACL